MSATHKVGQRIRTRPGSASRAKHPPVLCVHCRVVSGPNKHHFMGTITSNCDSVPVIYPAATMPDWYQVRLDCGKLIGIEASSFDPTDEQPGAGAWQHELDRKAVQS